MANSFIEVPAGDVKRAQDIATALADIGVSPGPVIRSAMPHPDDKPHDAIWFKYDDEMEAEVVQATSGFGPLKNVDDIRGAAQGATRAPTRPAASGGPPSPARPAGLPGERRRPPTPPPVPTTPTAGPSTPHTGAQPPRLRSLPIPPMPNSRPGRLPAGVQATPPPTAAAAPTTDAPPAPEAPTMPENAPVASATPAPTPAGPDISRTPEALAALRSHAVQLIYRINDDAFHATRHRGQGRYALGGGLGFLRWQASDDGTFTAIIAQDADASDAGIHVCDGLSWFDMVDAVTGWVKRIVADVASDVEVPDPATPADEESSGQIDAEFEDADDQDLDDDADSDEDDDVGDAYVPTDDSDEDDDGDEDDDDDSDEDDDSDGDDVVDGFPEAPAPEPRAEVPTTEPPAEAKPHKPAPASKPTPARKPHTSKPR